MTITESLIELFAQGDELSVTQVVEQLGCKRTSTATALQRLVARNLLVITKVVGNQRFYQEAGKAALEELKKPDIFEQCRQNWSGYAIHKIFGSASRAAA